MRANNLKVVKPSARVARLDAQGRDATQKQAMRHDGMSALKPQAAQRNELANQPHRHPHDTIPMKSDTGNQASARLPR